MMPTDGGNIYAIIPAAGLGKRMGNIKKPYITLKGKPIIAHTLRPFQMCDRVDGICIVVAKGDEELCANKLMNSHGMDKVIRIIPGGNTRQESVFLGLKSLPSNAKAVLIHDAVRPFITKEMITNSIEALEDCDGAVVAVPVKDTIKRVDQHNRVVETLDRTVLWQTQTPQTFKYQVIMQAHLNAQEKGIHTTDDASLVEALGCYNIKVVMGNYENIKITTPDDLILANAIIEARLR